MSESGSDNERERVAVARLQRKNKDARYKNKQNWNGKRVMKEM